VLAPEPVIVAANTMSRFGCSSPLCLLESEPIQYSVLPARAEASMSISVALLGSWLVKSNDFTGSPEVRS